MVLAASCGPSQAQNLLFDPSFETAGTWTYTNGANRYGPNFGAQRTGAFGVCLSTSATFSCDTGNNVQGTVSQQNVLVTRSGTYELLAYAQHPGGGGSSTLTARIDGTTAFVTVVPVSGYSPYSTTVSLAAGTYNVSFSGVTVGGVGLFIDDVSLMYMGLGTLGSGLPSNASSNVTNVANAIDNFVNAGGTVPSGFDGLYSLGPDQLAAALSQLSGQAATGAQQSAVQLMNQFLSTVLDPSLEGRGEGGATGFASEADAYASTRRLSPKETEAYAAVTPRDRMVVKAAPATWQRPRWSAWAAGYGGNSRTGGNAATGSSNISGRIYGAVGGADYLLSPDTRLGVALGGAATSYGLDGGLGGGRADSFQAAVYGRHQAGPAYVMGALAYAWQDVTTWRTVTVAGSDTLEGRFDANAFAARGEAGWRVVTPAFGVTPYAAVQTTTFWLPRYGEVATSGSSQFALAFGAQDVTATRSELGARLDRSYLLGGRTVTLRSRFAWAHDYDAKRAINASFQALPGASFTVRGAEPAPDAALVSAGAEMKWRNDITLAGSFEGEFSDNTESYAGKGVLRYVW